MRTGAALAATGTEVVALLVASQLVDLGLEELLDVLLRETLLSHHGQGKFTLDVDLLRDFLEHLTVELQLLRVLTHLSKDELLHQILMLSEQLVVAHEDPLACGALLSDLVLNLRLLLQVVAGKLLCF